MSEAPGTTQERRRTGIGILGKVLLFLLSIPCLFLAFLSLVTGAREIQVIMFFLFGWIAFLKRTLPNITWNWDLIGMGLFCTVGILLISHWFLAWITQSIASARNASWRWPWKWTWCGFASIILLFLVGMSIGGAAHQIGWIASNPDPWFERKGGKGGYWIEDINNVKQLELAVRMASEDAEGEVAKIHRELWNSKSEIFGSPDQAKSLMQSYQILLIMDEEHKDKIAGTIIFPRNGERRTRGAGGLYSFGEKYDRFSPNRLPEILKKHEGHLIAL